MKKLANQIFRGFGGMEEMVIRNENRGRYTFEMSGMSPLVVIRDTIPKRQRRIEIIPEFRGSP
jgi:hypothetical protein